MQSLPREERLRLLRFVCASAWADLDVNVAETSFLVDLFRELEVPDDERALVAGWLQSPPDPEDVDPMDVPDEHKRLLLDSVLQMIGTDGTVGAAEASWYDLLEQLLGVSPDDTVDVTSPAEEL